jgi:GNAT superfamily N-acetyltransferase
MPATSGDAGYIAATLRRHWISPTVWSRDVPFEADRLPAFIAWLEGERVGLVTYAPGGRECEVVTLSSDRENMGIGAALLSAAVDEARRLGCERIFLTTSNDNLRAIGFYQRRGWRIVAVYPGAIDRSRAREKAIPLIGASGIESHDELELELRL